MSLVRTAMDTVNYAKGFTSAITGVAAGSAIKSALNGAAGSIAGNTPVKQGALDAMSNYAGDAQQRIASMANTMPASPTAAANQAVGGTSKNDQLQQAMMQAMMQKIAEQNKAGQSATNKDTGAVDTSKLDKRVMEELTKLHKGMQEYVTKMNKFIKDYKEKNGETPVAKAMNDFADTVTKHGDPSKADFAPKKIKEALETLEKNKEVPDEFKVIARQAGKQSDVMQDIVNGNNGVILGVGDKLKEESIKSLNGKELSIPEDKLKPGADGKEANKNLTSFDAAHKQLQDATDKVSTDPKALGEYKDALKSFKSTFDAVKEDKTIDGSLRESLQKGYDKSIESLDLLDKSQDLSTKVQLAPDGKVPEDVQKDLNSFNKNLYNHVDEQANGDRGEIRKFYQDVKAVEPEVTKPTTPAPTTDSEAPTAQADKLDLNFGDDLQKDLEALDNLTTELA